MNPTVANTPLSRISTFRNFRNVLPWGSNFNNSGFATAEGPFNPSMVIKWLPLKDMSKKQDTEYTEYQKVVDNLRFNLKKGDPVKALAMSKNPKETKSVRGIVHLIKYEDDNTRIRIWVKDRKNNDIVEVHPESIYRENIKYNLEESKKYVKSFREF